MVNCLLIKLGLKSCLSEDEETITMGSIYHKFYQLKKGIAGNREKREFEYSFGMPKLEQLSITPMSAWNERILSELEFALSISKVQEGKYDIIIENCIDFLNDALEKDGVLSNTYCQQAERMLLSLESACKEWSIILAAHAHIDMNWMWGWQETVAATLSTFRTMLHIMEEYPEFCFSQSQASCYKIVEEYDPELMEKIKEKIKEKRWEVTATAWVETDKNMPSTESLIKHIQYTKEYMEKVWEVPKDGLKIDFSPDTFGHSEHIPTINQFGEVDYYYHCRGLDKEVSLYRWVAPSGKEVLAQKEPNWYNAAITPHIAMDLTAIANRNAGFQTALVIYGVGNHGGGPTRRDVEKAIQMMDWPIFPKLKFGTLLEYFTKAESVRTKLPMVEGEMNFFSPGCYTTQSRIKMGNKNVERSLIQAESFSALANTYLGTSYLHKGFQKAWENVLFTHFHDILTGSCVRDTREHAMGLYAESMAHAQTQTANALRVISEQIDTSFLEVEDIRNSQSEGAGVGFGLDNYTGVPNPERGAGITRVFHVFNSLPQPRKEVIELKIWDWTGDIRYIEFKDARGSSIPHHCLSKDFEHYWDHKYIRVLVEVQVPSLGYTTIVMREKIREEYVHYAHPQTRNNHEYSNIVLENNLMRAEFDYKNGNLIHLFDKEKCKTVNTKDIGLRFLHTESQTSNAWQIGRSKWEEEITEITKINSFSHGNLQSGFSLEKRISGSKVKETVTLYTNSKSLEYQYEIDWNELGTVEDVPVLVFKMPFSYDLKDYINSVPAGIKRRVAMDLDVPSTEFVTAMNQDGTSLMLSCDTKYGYRGLKNALYLTLINPSTYPDPDPERGVHSFKIQVSLVDNNIDQMYQIVREKHNPLIPISSNRHIGRLGLEQSFFEIKGEGMVLSGISIEKEDGLTIRLYNTSEEEQAFSLEFMNNIEEAVSINLREKTKGSIEIKEKTLYTSCKAKSLIALKLKLT